MNSADSTGSGCSLRSGKVVRRSIRQGVPTNTGFKGKSGPKPIDKVKKKNFKKAKSSTGLPRLDSGTEGQTSSTPEENAVKCVICLDTQDFEDFHPLWCGHSFHSRCVVLWFSNAKRWELIQCPLCRTTLCDLNDLKFSTVSDMITFYDARLRYISERLAFILEQIPSLRVKGGRMFVGKEEEGHQTITFRGGMGGGIIRIQENNTEAGYDYEDGILYMSPLARRGFRMPMAPLEDEASVAMEDAVSSNRVIPGQEEDGMAMRGDTDIQMLQGRDEDSRMGSEDEDRIRVVSGQIDGVTTNGRPRTEDTAWSIGGREVAVGMVMPEDYGGFVVQLLDWQEEANPARIVEEEEDSTQVVIQADEEMGNRDEMARVFPEHEEGNSSSQEDTLQVQEEENNAMY